jgi:copper chaperone
MTSTEQTTVYTVVGMTCGHCVRSVSQEISRIPGVSAVDVELSTGAVTVTGESATDADAVAAAVAEAGYEVVAP